jgi:hypothetical protein
MSKEPSKLELQRAMAERRHEERMARSRAQAPEAKIAPREFDRPKPTGRLDAAEVKTVSAKALAQAPKKRTPEAKVKAVVDRIEEVVEGKRKKLISHPDCPVCAVTRERARIKMQKRRADGA